VVPVDFVCDEEWDLFEPSIIANQDDLFRTKAMKARLLTEPLKEVYRN